ncbi:S8 family serine peptidase, partial [Candidatus Thioglobus sp.]
MLLLLAGCGRLGGGPNINVNANQESPGSTCIVSDGIEVNLTVSEISISESSSANVTLTATASNAPCEDITVTLSTSGTATSGTDYSALDGTTITIATNSTTGTKTFTATDDSVYEGSSETVIVDIASVSGSSATESGTQSVTVTLTENESAPTVSIASSTSSVTENGSNLTLTATSTQAADEAITVVIGTSGTAIEGTDYANVSDITIAAGSTTGTTSFDPTPDSVNEGAESATIAISSTSGAGSSKSGVTSIAITINEFALTTGTAFTEGSTSEQNTIKNRSSWTTVDQSSNTVHPFELLNLHKVHSFSSGGTSLTGVGQTIYISDSALNANHDSFTGKTVTMLDNPSTSSTSHDHGTHVASIAGGIVGETTQGVAPGASLVFSDFADNATNRASDLDTARSVHSAVVANHSWGYNDSASSAVTMTELESSAASAGRNVREHLAAAYWGGSTATSAYITALDNFQSSGVIVFANGNFSNDTGASFMGALPYYFNGTSDSVDLSDAWLSVMYAEFTGSSLASASASDFNRLGNPCGKAKEWCLVVDDGQIGAAGYVNSSGTSVWSVLSGSSMGAPMVSGGVALMAQAFPNHTPEQLVDRILASANNAWFTPDGNTTFTTHGNSIKHGYHSTWGQGVPDFYAALSPITSNANPFSMALYTGNSIQSSKAIDLNSSFITPSSSFGNAISQGMIGEIGYAYDALSGGFKYRMSSIVNMTDNEAPTISLSSELSKLDKQLEFGNNSVWKQNFSQVLSTLSKTDTLETNVTLGSSSIPVQSF